MKLILMPNILYFIYYMALRTQKKPATKVGGANIILDNLIAQGKAKPMIIVMPYGRAYPIISKSSGSLRNWDNLQVFEKDFYGNLMPWVEKLSYHQQQVQHGDGGLL